MASMNIEVVKEKDGYSASFTDYIKYGIFSGHGSTMDEAIGHCIVSNRESIGVTIELHQLGEVTVYSTEYGKPRKLLAE